jgi:hypothetical protein
VNIALMLAAVIAFAAYTGFVWMKGGESAVAGYKEKIEAADAQIAAQAKAATDAAANTIIDMTAAFDAGEANAKTVEKKVFVRVASDLTKYPVFQNPACVLPPQSFALLTAAMRGVRGGIVLPAEDVIVPAPVPVAPAPPGAHPKPIPRKAAP